MKRYMAIGLVSLVALAGIGQAQAAGFNPGSLANILGIKVEFHGSFEPAIHRLGPSSQVDKGDAADYEGSVGYLGQNGVAAIRFTRSECTDGWVAGSKDAVLLEKFSKSSLNLSHVGVGIVHLGASEKAVLAAFQAPLADRWRLANRKSLGGEAGWNFERTIQTKSGPFCDHVWISMAAKDGKISFIRVDLGGCDDDACRDTSSKQQ